MPHYRIYRLAEDDHIVSVRGVDAATDEEACLAAREGLKLSEENEVWLEARYVRRVSGNLQDNEILTGLTPKRWTDEA
jgi:hypothetical protein